MYTADRPLRESSRSDRIHLVTCSKCAVYELGCSVRLAESITLTLTEVATYELNSTESLSVRSPTVESRIVSPEALICTPPIVHCARVVEATGFIS